MFSAFWLDEIWSLKLVLGLQSPIEVLTRLHIDNNHILNSLYMYLIGDTSNWYLYRIPSFLAGVISLYLVWLLTRGRDRVAGTIAVLLFSLSYLMVVYSSEARGYSLMVLFCLLSLVLFRGIVEDLPEHRAIRILGFWLSSALGLLAHLTFLHFYLALAVWSIWVAFRSPEKGQVRKVVGLHVVPVLFFAFVFYIHIRHNASGGGPTRFYALVLSNAMSVAVGGSEFAGGQAWQNAVSGILAAVVALAAMAELWLLRRDGKQSWTLYVTAVIAAPALTLVVMRPSLVFIRYFLVSILFLYFILAGFLARIYRRGPAGRVVCVALLSLYCVGHMHYLVPFHSDGRGDYLAAMRYMASSTQGKIVTVASDNGFRNGLVIDYYQRFFKDKRFEHGGVSGSGRFPEWWLLHSFDRRSRPGDAFWVGGHRYRLEAAYPHAAVSGWSWFVYRRQS